MHQDGYSIETIALSWRMEPEDVAILLLPDEARAQAIKERTRIRRLGSPEIRKKRKNDQALYQKDYRERVRQQPFHGLKAKIYRFVRKTDIVITVEDIIKKFGPNPTCYITGRPIDYNDPKTYHLDHIVPRAMGGSSTLDNMGLACPEANQMKHKIPLDEFVRLCRVIGARFPDIM